MVRRKYRYSFNDVVDKWAKNSGEWRWASVGRWLNSIQKTGDRCHSLFLFCEWCGKNPDELLALKKNGGLEAEYLLDEFTGLDGSADAPYPNSIMWNCVQSVRSFFKKNYLSLEPAAGKMTLRKVRPYRKHTRDQLVQIFKACYDPRDRSMVATVFCSAIAKETLMNLKWLHFEEDWENREVPHISVPDTLLKGHGVGRWKGVQQETFLTPEAKRELLYYRGWMEKLRGEKFSRDDFVYVSLHKPYGQLNRSTMGAVHQRISKRLPFVFSWHDGRRYVQTALEEAGLSHNWIQKIKGRKVRGEDNPYSLPEIDKLREAYRRALPNLCFLDVEAMVAKKEVDSVKLIVGEQSLRERELARQIEELRKEQEGVQELLSYLPLIKESLKEKLEKEKGN